MTDQSTPSETTGTQTVDTPAAQRFWRSVPSPDWLARGAGIGLSVVSLGFVLLFITALQSGGELALLTRPIPMRIALALPYFIAVLAFGTVVGAGLAWWQRYWSLLARIHQTILAVLGLGFTWQLTELGLLAL